MHANGSQCGKKIGRVVIADEIGEGACLLKDAFHPFVFQKERKPSHFLIHILGQFKAVEIGDVLLPLYIWSVVYLIVLSVILLPLYILVYTKRPTVLSLRVLYIISEKVHKLPLADRFILAFKEFFRRRVSHSRDKKFRHMSVSRHEIFKTILF